MGLGGEPVPRGFGSRTWAMLVDVVKVKKSGVAPVNSGLTDH